MSRWRSGVSSRYCCRDDHPPATQCTSAIEMITGWAEKKHHVRGRTRLPAHGISFAKPVTGSIAVKWRAVSPGGESKTPGSHRANFMGGTGPPARDRVGRRQRCDHGNCRVPGKICKRRRAEETRRRGICGHWSPGERQGRPCVARTSPAQPSRGESQRLRVQSWRWTKPTRKRGPPGTSADRSTPGSRGVAFGCRPALWCGSQVYSRLGTKGDAERPARGGEESKGATPRKSVVQRAHRQLPLTA